MTTDEYGAVFYYENGVLNVEGSGQVVNEAGGSSQALGPAAGLFVIGGAVYYDGWACTQDDSGTLNLYDSATFTNYGSSSADIGCLTSGVVIGGTLNDANGGYQDYGTTELWPN